MIPMTERVEQYLAQRERLGTGLSASAVQILRTFASFAVEQGEAPLTTDLFWRWKAQYGSAGRQCWSIRLSHVRTFARWLHSLEPETEIPPTGLISRTWNRPRPYIYTDEEIAAIVTRAAQLPSAAGLRGPTYATLFGLLAVTGLRISEALALDDPDVDTSAALLHIRKAKNHGSRVLPVTACTAERLDDYRSVRNRVAGSVKSPAFFLGDRGQRISIFSAENNFAWVGQDIGLRARLPRNGKGRGPRLHDLRHTMATRTLIDWVRSGRDPDRERYKLSAWLGHQNPAGTYWYLEAVPELLQRVTERAEQSLAPRRPS